MNLVQIDEKAVFNAARHISDAAARESYLQLACGEDVEAIRRIRDLLQVHEQEQSFLESPAISAVAATLVQRPLSESPGMVIGPYKLLEQIGEGGFGVVFMAEQTAPVKRKVALKVIKPGMDTRQVIARFEAERQALALMDHPHIAKVLDAGATASGRPYFVMELVKGVPITEYCDQHQLPPRERLELFVAVCHAVQHAHQKGIIHRDIKPSNVLVSLHDDQPVVKVIDFGIAKATSVQLTDKTLFTGFAQLVGTPLYMSPEQAALNAIDVDTRSDVYSLGVLLYELLTGTTPFDKARLQAAAFDEVRRIIREEEPQKPSTRLSSSDLLPSVAANRHLEPSKLTKLVQGDLDWIVMKALEKDRARRYETANGFAADVLHYLADEPVTACPPSAVYRFRKFARRNRRTLATASILAAGLVVAVIVLAISNVLVRTERNAKDKALAEKVQALGEKDAALIDANQARGAETAAKNEALALRDRAIADAYRAQLGETRALREARLPGWRETALGNLQQLARLETPVRDLVELRSEAAACLSELDVRETDRFEAHLHLVYGLDFSPDGRTLATAGYDGKVYLWRLGERRPATQLTDEAASRSGLWGNDAPLPVVRFRPGGQCLAYSTWSRQVRFHEPDESGRAPLAIASQSQPRDIAFDRDGKLMAVSWGSGQVGIYDAQTGELKRTIEAHTPQIGFYMRVALSPDGHWLAARGPGETVQLFDLNSEAQPIVLGSHGGLVRGLAFNRDGRYLASVSEDRTAKVWDIDGRRNLFTLQGHTGKVISVAFSPDDELIATGSDDGSLRLWETQTGQPLMVVPRASPGLSALQGVQAVAFSPDGTRIAAASQSVVVFEISPRRLRRLPGHGFLTSAVAFHPDKPILAASSRDRDLTLWDVQQGRAIERISNMNCMAGGLAFHPDGSVLVAAPYTRMPVSYGGDFNLLTASVCVLDSGDSALPGNLPGRLSAAVAFDPSGRWLATGDREGQVWLWDVATGKLKRRWSVTEGWITDVAFVDKGSRLIIGGIGGRIVLWDLEQDQPVGEAALPGGIFRLGIDPHEHWIAVADFMGEIRLLSLPDLKVQARLDKILEPGLVGLAFRGNGDWLAAGGADRRVTIWDTRTFEKSFELPLLNSTILDLAFQPDGSRLAVATTDEQIPIWDVDGLRSDLMSLGMLSDAPVDRPLTELPPENSWTVQRITPPPLVTPEWAMWLLERLLQVDPDQPQICVTLAWMQVMGPRALRDPDAALPLALRAVQLAPQQPDCLNTLGVVYYRLGRWDEAIETLQASARTNPQGATGYDLMFLAMSYQQLGEAKRAREQFDLASRWWSEAQLSAEQMIEWKVISDEAERLLRGEAEPTLTAAEQFAEGQTHARMMVWPSAARYFLRATQLAPDDAEPWAELGRCHAHLAEWPDAVVCFGKAVERDPGNIQYWYESAIASAGAGDLDGYRRTCAEMVGQFGDTTDPGIASRVLYACLPVQDAGAPAEQLVRIAGVAESWFQGNVRVVAAALYRNGDDKAALQRFAEFHAVGKPKAWDWLFEAMLALRLNRWDEAQQCMARATAWMEQADQFGYGQSEDRWVDWFEPVEVGLLLREAQALLSASQQKDPGDSGPRPLKTTLNEDR